MFQDLLCGKRRVRCLLTLSAALGVAAAHADPASRVEVRRVDQPAGLANH